MKSLESSSSDTRTEFEFPAEEAGSGLGSFELFDGLFDLLGLDVLVGKFT